MRTYDSTSDADETTDVLEPLVYLEDERTNISLKTKKGIEVMTHEVFTRWAALALGMEMIHTHAEKCNIDTSKTSAWLKPRPLQRFIGQKYNELYHRLYVERFGRPYKPLNN